MDINEYYKIQQENSKDAPVVNTGVRMTQPVYEDFKAFANKHRLSIRAALDMAMIYMMRNAK